MEGVVAPIPPWLRRALRTAALDHALAERRLAHRPVLHVGRPGDDHEVLSVTLEEPADHTLRVDMVAAALCRARHRTPEPIVWLARTGALVDEDADLAWLAAARQAFAEASVPLVYVVVNRHGWRDPRSGAERQWARLRRY
jgi:hypothetical protein